jgi:hypothetical protein
MNQKPNKARTNGVDLRENFETRGAIYNARNDSARLDPDPDLGEELGSELRITS